MEEAVMLTEDSVMLSMEEVLVSTDVSVVVLVEAHPTIRRLTAASVSIGDADFAFARTLIGCEELME
jgi:hypothetical protein